jgi:hypothetical protein
LTLIKKDSKPNPPAADRHKTNDKLNIQYPTPNIEFPSVRNTHGKLLEMREEMNTMGGYGTDKNT